MLLPVAGYLAGRIGDFKRAFQEALDISEKESSDLMESVETIERFNIELQDRIEQRTEELHISNENLQKALAEIESSHERLIQSEKMATVGRLAAGMAHELNNPVGAIRNYLQDLLEDTGTDDSRHGRLMRAEKATDRCRKIVEDLLVFARSGADLDAESVDVNEVIERTIADAKECTGDKEKKIEILTALDPTIPVVNVDCMQLQQVFMNVIMNACDVIEKEGRITLRSRNGGEHIHVEISDTGAGIPEEYVNKVFDPFFTTKGPGKRKGLGLAISYSILRRLGGDIRVESQVGVGTTFTVDIPTITEEVKESREKGRGEQ